MAAAAGVGHCCSRLPLSSLALRRSSLPGADTEVCTHDEHYSRRIRCCETSSLLCTILSVFLWVAFSLGLTSSRQWGCWGSFLVDVLCKSVGVLLAEVRAGGAGALTQGPAEGAAATSLTGADHGPPNGGDLTWLPVRGPVLAVPGDMFVGCPGGCGCCSLEWGKSPVETCGPAACWVGWVLTGDLSGTRTGAVGLTGHSVQG